MKIKNVSYVGSFTHDQPFPVGLGPEFALVGRSNVGKSSLINTLVGRRNIARTSNTPGKTRTANFYPVDERLCFVDLPGYGYAQVSKSERAGWARLLESYLRERAELGGVIHLLDVRHPPSEKDRETSSLLEESGRPVCAVFTKIDKVKKGEVDRLIARHLGSLCVDERTAVVAFSAETGAGRQPLWAWIEDKL